MKLFGRRIWGSGEDAADTIKPKEASKGKDYSPSQIGAFVLVKMKETAGLCYSCATAVVSRRIAQRLTSTRQ